MVTAIVMVGDEGGESEAVAWVQGARRAATRDILAQLDRQPLIDRVILLSPARAGFTQANVDRFVRTAPGAVHVGNLLAQLIEEEEISHLFYFGGGAAPLLSDATLAELLEVMVTSDRILVTNNRFASDWAGVVPALTLCSRIDRLPRDNMLGWVLSTEAGLPVKALPPAAESRLDLDTPLDLQILRMHPRTKIHLRSYLEALPLDATSLREVLSVLVTPASHVFISGRISPEAWAALNRATHSWVRVLAEERGMVSSGRQARREVYSLLAAQMEAVGMDAFFQTLSTWADAALLDTRVLLAHHGLWPESSVRFASDLGRVAEVHDKWLRALTEQALAAPIPIILGGHGLMAGNLYALIDLLPEATEPPE